MSVLKDTSIGCEVSVEEASVLLRSIFYNDINEANLNRWLVAESKPKLALSPKKDETFKFFEDISETDH